MRLDTDRQSGGFEIMWLSSCPLLAPTQVPAQQSDERCIAPSPGPEPLVSSILPQNASALRLRGPTGPGSAAPHHLADCNLRGCRASARGRRRGTTRLLVTSELLRREDCSSIMPCHMACLVHEER
jgi:hypothetical protein